MKSTSIHSIRINNHLEIHLMKITQLSTMVPVVNVSIQGQMGALLEQGLHLLRNQSGMAGAHLGTLAPVGCAAMVVKWHVHILLKSFTGHIALWQGHPSFMFILSHYIRGRVSQPEE